MTAKRQCNDFFLYMLANMSSDGGCLSFSFMQWCLELDSAELVIGGTVDGNVSLP